MNTTIRVLVVDDFNKFREWLCLKLKTNARFFVAGEAANGREARYHNFALSFARFRDCGSPNDGCVAFSPRSGTATERAGAARL